MQLERIQQENARHKRNGFRVTPDPTGAKPQSARLFRDALRFDELFVRVRALRVLGLGLHFLFRAFSNLGLCIARERVFQAGPVRLKPVAKAHAMLINLSRGGLVVHFFEPRASRQGVAFALPRLHAPQQIHATQVVHEHPECFLLVCELVAFRGAAYQNKLRSGQIAQGFALAR